MNTLLNLASRVLLAQVFLIAGIQKIPERGYAGTQGYMAKFGVPADLLPLVIVLEIGGALALMLGFQTRLAALALAGFCVASAFIFHSNLGNGLEALMFTKDLAMAGGLLLLVQYGGGAVSLDTRGKR